MAWETGKSITSLSESSAEFMLALNDPKPSQRGGAAAVLGWGCTGSGGTLMWRASCQLWAMLLVQGSHFFIFQTPLLFFFVSLTFSLIASCSVTYKLRWLKPLITEEVINWDWVKVGWFRVRIQYLLAQCLFGFDPYLYFVPDVHLTNVAVQKTAPDYDPEKVSEQHCLHHAAPAPARGAGLADRSKLTSLCQLPCCAHVLQPLNCAAVSRHP